MIRQQGAMYFELSHHDLALDTHGNQGALGPHFGVT